MALEATHRYDDIIGLPHHRSYARPHMSAHDRAAQFMPFAALAGYDRIIARTADHVERAYADDASRGAAVHGGDIEDADVGYAGARTPGGRRTRDDGEPERS